MSQTNKTPNDFDLKALLDMTVIDALLSTNCHAVGTVQAFHSVGKQTVDGTINYKRTINGELVDYPVLIDCPLIILGGGTGSLTFPVAPGDTCIFLFNDRDINNWFAGIEVGDLASNRLHSFTDAFALIGPRSLLSALPAYDPSRVVLQNLLTAVKLGPSTISIENASTDLKTVLNGLIDVIAGITIGSAPIDPPKLLLLNLYKLAIGSLLT